MTWIYKLLDPFNLSPWKILFNDKYRKYGADKIWMMNKDSIEQISIYFNRFWKDILLNWAKLRNASHDHNDLMGQPIWFNKLLKIDNKTIIDVQPGTSTPLNTKLVIATNPKIRLSAENPNPTYDTSINGREE